MPIVKEENNEYFTKEENEGVLETLSFCPVYDNEIDDELMDKFFYIKEWFKCQSISYY